MGSFQGNEFNPGEQNNPSSSSDVSRGFIQNGAHLSREKDGVYVLLVQILLSGAFRPYSKEDKDVIWDIAKIAFSTPYQRELNEERRMFVLEVLSNSFSFLLNVLAIIAPGIVYICTQRVEAFFLTTIQVVIFYVGISFYREWRSTSSVLERNEHEKPSTTDDVSDE